MIRYLSGLLVCGLGLLGGGWLIVVVVLLRGTPTNASLASLGTGAGVALLSAIGIACWSVAWRQRMRLDGVLATRHRPVAGGTHDGEASGRSRRALRRDMRHAARAARRSTRRDEATTARGARPGEVASLSPGEDLHPVVPGPRIPLAAETSHVLSRGPEEPEPPRAVLTELRAMLEPLLTTSPMPVLDSEPDDPAAWDLLGEEESW